jgi:Fe-S cluster biogenesis protein NfuA
MTSTVAPSLSEKALARLQGLRHLGSLSGQLPAGCRLLESSHGPSGAPEHIRLQFAVDGGDRVQVVRYATPATGGLLLVYEILADLCTGISLRQAAHVTPLQVLRKLRDAYEVHELSLPWPQTEPFPILTKICAVRAPDLVVPQEDQAERWDDLGLFEKVRRIEKVLDEHVRPMLATDGGGLELVDLKGDELVVQYQGACGSCSSSVGGTLAFIQETLNDHLGCDLSIKPEGLDTAAFAV